VALTLLPAFSGERPPLFDEQRLSSYFRAGAFSGRVGRRVLPTFLSVEDDPLRAELEDAPCSGPTRWTTRAPAQRVSLVEQGVLKPC
jgi:hypothetical protein